jgi:hypothetical protein
MPKYKDMCQDKINHKETIDFADFPISKYYAPPLAILLSYFLFLPARM